MSRHRSRAAAAPAPGAPPPAARPRVVISTYDGPASPHYRGGGAASMTLAAACLAGDCEVTVVTAARRGGTELRDGVRYRYLPVSRAGPRAGQLLFTALLPLAARRIPHDLWLESFTPPFSVSLLPLLARGRVAGVAQNLSGEEMSRRYHLPFWRIERFGLRFYHDVVVLSPADGQRVARCNPAAAVHVIPNCTEVPELAGQQPGSGEHILWLGRVGVWEKGLDLLLSAYRQARPGLPLLLAGGGTRAEEGKLAALLGGGGQPAGAAAGASAPAGHVRWLGEVSGARKRALLERSAFLVLPSRHEALGIAALEGMARGKPVVHFDLPSLAWMAGDVRVAPFDITALARELGALAADGDRRRALGRAAYAAAVDYGPDRLASRYRALVAGLLGVRARAGSGPA